MSGADGPARSQGFAPVCAADTRLLILGSLPGGASLAAAQYYAHPRNEFWRLVGGVIGRDLVALPYEARLAALRKARIGLWDVVASAERAGSLDAAIRQPEQADLASLVGQLPELAAIAFNGGLAAKLGRKNLGASGILRSGIVLIDLPSSSPAHARPLEEKARCWALLNGYVDGAPASPPTESR